jgi:hypothetical protein
MILSCSYQESYKDVFANRSLYELEINLYYETGVLEKIILPFAKRTTCSSNLKLKRFEVTNWEVDYVIEDGVVIFF